MKKGFTLIELLLGIVLFALIAVTVYSIFSAGIRLSNRFQQQGDLYGSARWVFDQMQRDLENMVPYDFSNSYPDRTAVIGKENQIIFLMPTERGLKAVRYYLGAREEGTIHQVIVGETFAKNVAVVLKEEKGDPVEYLIREEQDFSDFVGGRAGSKEVVAANIEKGSLKFAYAFLEVGENPQIFWKNLWTEIYLPAGVRIEMKFINPEEPEQNFLVYRDVVIPHGAWGQEGL